MNRRGALRLTGVMLAAALAGPARSAPADRRLGMNLGGVIDWSSEWPFVDAFKTSRPWIETGPGPFTYNDRGDVLLRPGQAVETFLFRDIGGHFPAGDYVATYEGGGEVDITRFDVAEVLERTAGRIRFRVRRPTDGGIFVRVTASPPRNPVRNLRVLLPGFEKTQQIVHPLYVERLKPFGILRFMDWQRTNNSPLVTWSQRPRPDDARYSTDLGVPAEVIIDATNACRTDPWFCIPHQADDEFVGELARLIGKRLDAALTPYVEYSNEVWNEIFAQSKFASERGRKLGLGEPPGPRYYAQRAVEVFRRFADSIGGRKFIRVLGGHFANPYGNEAMLSWNETHKHADAFAVGAYFGNEFGSPARAKATAQMRLESLLDGCQAEIEGQHRQFIRRNAELAKKYGLKLLAYEGGQHLVGHGGLENNDALTGLFHAANRHPRMADLYRLQLKAWFDEGGGPFVAFSYAGLPSKWGSWGVLEYQEQPSENAPKYRALVNAAREFAGR